MLRQTSRPSLNRGSWHSLGLALVTVFACEPRQSAFESFSRDICELQMPCCAAVGRPSTGNACRALMTALAPSVAFDPVNAERCLTDLRAAEREADFCRKAPEGFESCRRAYSVRGGDKALGATCREDSECASSPDGEVLCTGNAQASGICQVLRNGTEGDGPCIGVRRTDGGFVTFADESAEALGDAYLCLEAADLVCDQKTRTCAARKPSSPFGPCTRHSSLDCPMDQYCNADDRCAPRFTIGASCTEREECEANTAFCDPASKTCANRRPAGSACTSARECEADGTCEAGVCRSAVADLKWSFVCGGD